MLQFKDVLILRQLLRSFLDGKTDPELFCDKFETLYNFELDRKNISVTEKAKLENLFNVATLYSPYIEDRKAYSGYSDEIQVREAAEEAYKLLSDI